MLTASLFVRESAAAYVLTPLVQGESSAVIAPGEAFQIDVLLTSDSFDVHNSAIFVIAFSEPGLILESYAWASPYETGSKFDASTPPIGSLPLTIDKTILTGPAYPPGLIGVEFANVVPKPQGTFGDGVLVTLTVHVPLDFLDDFDGDVATITIDALPDTIAHGFEIIPTSSGQTLTITVVPSTPTLALLILGLSVSNRRRNRGLPPRGYGSIPSPHDL